MHQLFSLRRQHTGVRRRGRIWRWRWRWRQFHRRNRWQWRRRRDDGGAGSNGAGEGGSSVGAAGLFGGAATLNGGGGGGGGIGGAIFIRTGSLDLQNTLFDQNASSGGASALGSGGQGKGGAIAVLADLGNGNGNDQGMPSVLPTITGCANAFSANSASDAGTSIRDNADVYGIDRVALTLACGDGIFADGFGIP